MPRRVSLTLALALVFAAVLVPSPGRSVPSSRAAAPALDPATARDAFGKLPISFEPNAGQADPTVKFLARGAGATLLLTEADAVLAVQPTAGAGEAAVLRMRPVGADPAARPAASDPLTGTISYLRGNDRAGWQAGLPTYRRVSYASVYPGIDLVYHGDAGHLEYDFVVAPGANPNVIRLAVEGADALAIDGSGDLLLETAAGQVRQGRPVLYQDVDGERRSVEGSYLIDEAGQVAFAVGGYDAARPLVIDPVLAYAALLGGSGRDDGTGIAVDGTGHAYITGTTLSPAGFPTVPGGNVFGPGGGRGDVFVAKLSPSGTSLVYLAVLGGTDASGGDFGHAIAVDGSGSAYVTGTTRSSDFPTVPSGNVLGPGGSYQAFVAKLSPNGTALVYSALLGGGSIETGRGITVDGSGSAYVTGDTGASPDFPTVPSGNVLGTGGSNDTFVVKLSPAGTALTYSALLGGTGEEIGYGIAIDGAGNAYIAGESSSGDFPGTTSNTQFGPGGDIDAFVVKLNPSGTALTYGLKFGGSAQDRGFGIAVDGAGAAYVTGESTIGDVTPVPGGNRFGPGGNFDAFVAKVVTDGTSFAYATLLGGTGDDRGFGIAVDGAGNAYVAGYTSQGDFPTVPPGSRLGPTGQEYGFVAKIGQAGTSVASSTLLSDGFDVRALAIGIDGAGNAYVTGSSAGTQFPTTPPGTVFGTRDSGTVRQGDVFVAKLPPTTGLSLSKSGQATVRVNDTATFTFTATNAGPHTAQHVVMRDPLPPNTTFQAFTAPAGWACTTPAVGQAGTVVCTRPSFAPGSADFTRVVRVAPATPNGTALANTATLGAGGPNTTVVDAAATATTSVIGAADLEVSVTATPNRPAAGTPVTFTVGVRNNGPTAATDVTLNVRSTGGQAGAPQPSQGTCTLATNAYDCVLGTVAPGSTATVSITFSTATAARLTVAAVAGAFQPDLIPTNNHAETAVVVDPPPLRCPPHPDVAMTATPEPGRPGQLRVTLTATSPPGQSGNVLRSIAFGPASNGLIDAGDQTGRTGDFGVTLPPGTTTTTFVVRRVNPGQPTTVPFVVEDACGGQPKFVGGGPGAF